MLRSILSALALTAAVAVPSFAAGERGFTVSNTNGKASIVKLWYAQSGSGKAFQEMDLKYPIGPSSRSTFTVPASDYCLYDVRLRFNDGTEQETNNVNVCKGAGVNAT